MKLPLFTLLIFLAGCAPYPSDNATIEVINKSRCGVYISKWENTFPVVWRITLEMGDIKIYGEGKSLALAYENAIKNKEKLCNDFR